LNPTGTYVPVGGEGGRWMIPALARALATLVLSHFASQKLVPFFLAKTSKEDLAIMHELMQSGKVTPAIDRRYTLSEVPEAIRYLEARHARGKVIITLESA
jgi:NADPH:quinone reductase-like Zn-dependent oxidoreductase